MKKLSAVAVLSFLALFCRLPGLAQSSPHVENGFKPYGSYDGSHLDTVNLMNGNVMLHAPLLPDAPQRGSIRVSNTIYLSSKDWQVGCAPGPTGPNCSWQKGGAGVYLQFAPSLSVHRTLDTAFGGGEVITQAYGYTLVTADQNSHLLHGVLGTEDVNLEPTQFDSVDLSGFHLTVDPASDHMVVVDRAGTRYEGDFRPSGACGKAPKTLMISSPGPIQPVIDDAPFGDRYCAETALPTLITDSNGNQISPRAIAGPGIDTLGKVIFPAIGNATTGFSGCVSAYTIAYAFIYPYQDPNGATQQIKFCQAELPIQTGFSAISGNGAAIAEAATGVNGLHFIPIVTIILGDGTRWTFDYDIYGEVKSVGLPTGGSIQYTWKTVNSLSCNNGNPTLYSRAVAFRTLTDNLGHSSVWQYNWGTATTSSLTNVATDPNGNDTVHVFSDQNFLAGLSPACKFYETSTIEYQGPQAAGNLLRRVDTAYTGNLFGTDGSAGATLPNLGNVFATDIVTTAYPSGKVKKVHRDPDPGLGAGLPGFGNVVKELEFDWGPGSPGPILRETDTVYKWQKDGSYLSAHLLDLPASRVVISSIAASNTKSGCPVSPSATANCMAENDYTYDEPAYLTSASISTQHVAPPNGVRGNPTTTSSWLSTANSFIASHTNWYDTGEPFKKIDPLGHTTTMSYDPADFGGYLTQTCSPNTGAVTHCVSGAYDFTTGVLNSLTDQNGQISNYTYDFMFHIATAQGPLDQANGARATSIFTYSDMSSPPTLPLTITRVKSVTNALTDSVTAKYDGLGRAVTSLHAMPTGAPSTVDTVYDDLNNRHSVSNPYFSAADTTYGAVTTQLDALGRPTTITEQDGSSRAVSYDVVTPGSAGNCTLTTDEVGNQRNSCSDGLGRLVEVDEPNPNSSNIQAQATLTINDPLEFQGNVGQQNAAYATAQVTIGGFDGKQTIKQNCTAKQIAFGNCDPTPVTTVDVGTVHITVNGREYDFVFGQTGVADTPVSVAQALVNAIQADTARAVSASISTSASNIVVLTALNLGTAGNAIPFSSGSTSDFTTSPLTGSLANGVNFYAGVTVYDKGSVTLNAGGFPVTVCYGRSTDCGAPPAGCAPGDSTASQVACRLASALNVAASPVTAVNAGASLTLTNKTQGQAGNAMPVSYGSSSTQSQFTFSAASFSSNTPGITLSNGLNAGAANNQPYVTLYSYDALGNLLCVEQHGNVSGTGCSAPPTSDASSPWRVRRFTYDSLSRLLTAHNPESGNITYLYDADGNLLQKTSPLANQTGSSTQTVSYCYDELHRVTGKVYSAQSCPLTLPTVSYAYDSGSFAIGKLTSLTDQAGTANFYYDNLGRMTSETRVINGVSKSMSYDYNLDGSIKTIHYPSGAAVTYTPDSAGRTLSAVDPGNNINYATGATYQADGQLTGFVSGNAATFAGITNIFNFNKRLQPINMSASAPSQTVFSIGYDFHLGNGTTGSDNGNVWGITNYKDNSRNQSFNYDSLNRLTSAQNAGTANPPPPSDCNVLVLQGKTKYWGNSYTYDAWGNLTNKTITKCGAENLNAPALANNQLTGYGYDAAGNMTSDPTDGGLSLSYDQENRITGAGGYTYTYDADGNRVKKTNGSTGTIYWYMTPGIVAESDLSGVLKSEYVFFDGERVARRDNPGSPGATVAYYFSDHLKTASVITDSLGNIKSESDYYPWGGELQFVANDSNHYKFTGKERDETGLDYFGARYYSNGLARFITPDWAAKAAAVPYSEFADPQSLNQYSYVRNVPTSKVDADGHTGPHGECDFGSCQDKRGSSIVSWLGSWFNHSTKTGDPRDNTNPSPEININGSMAERAPAAVQGFAFIAATGSLLDPSGTIAVAQAFADGHNGQGVVFLGLMFIPGGSKGGEAIHVYQIIKDGEVIYVGITNNLVRRAGEHGAQLDHIVTTLSRDEARAVEQALIEHHGLEKNGGTLTNKINSISPKSSRFLDAFTLGIEILQSIR